MSNEKNLIRDENILLSKERTLLSSERTFLAWVRTGLASVGGGVAITRFFLFQNPVHQKLVQMIGATLVVLGIAIFFCSFLDYYRNYKKLSVETSYAGSLFSILIITFILSVVSLILFLIMLDII